MNLTPDNSGEEEKPTPETENENEVTPEEESRKIKVYSESVDGQDEDSPSEGSQEQADLMMSEIAGPQIYKIGDKVTGKVVLVKDDSLVVNIGTKNEGIVPREELSYVPSPSTEGYEPGQEIDMVVIRQADDDTYYLSKRRAEEEKSWQAVEAAYTNGTRIKAIGSQVVSAGLILDMGIRGFMPLSHSDIKRIDVTELLGKEFEVKVLEFNRESRPQRLVVSRRAVLEEDLTRERDELYEKLQPGDVITGKVEKLTSFGAFINLGGVTGLLHISQMSRRRISDPSEVVKVGEEIDVKIIDVDREKRKIRLSRRELLADPWDEIDKQYRPGDVVDGIVVRVTSFGAFIKIDNYFEGLAHISELVDNKINHAKEVFSPGDPVPVMILEIDKGRKRIRLSTKKAVEKQARKEVDAFMKQQEDIRITLRIPEEGIQAIVVEPEPVVEEEPTAEPAPPTEGVSPAEEPAAEAPPVEATDTPTPPVEKVEEVLPTVETPPEKVEEIPTLTETTPEAPEKTEEVPKLEVEETPSEDKPEPAGLAEEPGEPAAEEKAEAPAEEVVSEEQKPTEEPVAEPAKAVDADDERELISGEEFDDTGQPDLDSTMNLHETSDEIDLVEGGELDEK